MKLKADCSWKKSYEQLSILKKQRIVFVEKGPYSQSYGFSSSHVWMWQLDHQEVLNTKKLILLNCGAVPWTARSNQSILKETNTEHSLEGLMLKLKLQYFWPPDAKNWLIGKDPDAGKGGEGSNRVWDGWMAPPTQRTWVWASSGRWWRIGKPGMLQFMWSQRVVHNWVSE